MSPAYWEPVALVEVSCRNGFSLMKPGGVGGRGDAKIMGQEIRQSCKPRNGKFFYEVRVWVPNRITRMAGFGDRAMADSTVQCGGVDGNKRSDKYGYSIKMDTFSKGPMDGPARAWTAYISDNDVSWSKDPAGAAPKAPPPQKPCKTGTVDMESCWGPQQPLNGWVTHTNPAVAAALVSWRGVQKALGMGKLPKDLSGKGYRMSLDYPFIKRSAAYAQQKGVPGGGGRGSDCFTPGDAGPWWYTANQQNLTPDKIPEFIGKLKDVPSQAAATANPDVYVFTYWVHTECTIYTKQIGICSDKYKH